MPSLQIVPAHRPTRILPKHQALCLKCYPRADVKPNSSELAYLLYYASTRQEKLQKVGRFLETRTARDVWRWQSARVHVTLHILTAFLEHNTINRASGFALIAPSVLRILREIITNTNDISLIEATTATWTTFCQHQNAAILAADSEYRALYAEIVHLYGTLAKNSPKKLAKSTQPVAQHDALRMRKVGVVAIMSIFAPTEQLERAWLSEFDTSLAAVLTNLRNPDKRDYIDYLQGMNGKPRDEDVDEQRPVNRRQSLATLRTISGLPDDQEPDPDLAEATVELADRLEEEEVGLLAIECIKSIFETQNRAQVRAATVAYMRYIAEEESREMDSGSRKHTSEWATQLFRLITTWTPVQDRFVILFTAQETLGRLPIEGSSFRPHETYTKMMHGVVCSDLNLIGLSVMDVLVGLLTTTIRAIAYCTRLDTNRPSTASSSERSAAAGTIQQLKDCIACLASHIYYSDQVTDMIAAILVRVRAYPSAADIKKDIFGEDRSPFNVKTTEAKNSVNSGAALRSSDTGVDPKASANDIAAPAVDLAANESATADDTARSIRPETSQRSNSLRSSYFTTDEARKNALEIIKSIIETAQSTRKQSHGNVVINRNRVTVGVWDGTQWLARDGSEKVRTAYREAVTTWAQFESDEKDPKILDFEAEDCFGKFVEKTKPPSLRGSVGQSHQSHPQLLMLPNFGVERRLSSGKNSSNGTDQPKLRVRAKDLEEIMDGKRHVELHGTVEKTDLKKLLASIKIDDTRKSKVLTAPPY